MQLRETIGKKTVALAEHQEYADDYDRGEAIGMDGKHKSPSALISLINTGETVARKISLKKTEHEAAKHLKKNEGAYQAQALNEASDDGVEITDWDK